MKHIIIDNEVSSIPEAIDRLGAELIMSKMNAEIQAEVDKDKKRRSDKDYIRAYLKLADDDIVVNTND